MPASYIPSSDHPLQHFCLPSTRYNNPPPCSIIFQIQSLRDHQMRFFKARTCHKNPDQHPPLSPLSLSRKKQMGKWGLLRPRLVDIFILSSFLLPRITDIFVRPQQSGHVCKTSTTLTAQSLTRCNLRYKNHLHATLYYGLMILFLLVSERF